jgi:hypothetical protein
LTILANKPVKIIPDIVVAWAWVHSSNVFYGGDSFAQKKPDPVGIKTLMRTGHQPESFVRHPPDVLVKKPSELLRVFDYRPKTNKP